MSTGLCGKTIGKTEVLNPKIEDMEEIWIETNGLDNYEVSSFGRVRNKKTGRYLSISTSKCGYSICSLWSGRKPVKFHLARLMLLSFVGQPPHDGYHAAHNNGIKSDNCLSNIRWATPKENAHDKVRHGFKNARGYNKPRNLNTKEVAYTLKHSALAARQRHISILEKSLPISAGAA